MTTVRCAATRLRGSGLTTCHAPVRRRRSWAGGRDGGMMVAPGRPVVRPTRRRGVVITAPLWRRERPEGTAGGGVSAGAAGGARKGRGCVGRREGSGARGRVREGVGARATVFTMCVALTLSRQGPPSTIPLRIPQQPVHGPSASIEMRALCWLPYQRANADISTLIRLIPANSCSLSLPKIALTKFIVLPGPRHVSHK